MEKYNCQYLFGLINDTSLRNIYYGKVIPLGQLFWMDFFLKFFFLCYYQLIVAVMAVAVKGALHLNESNS